MSFSVFKKQGNGQFCLTDKQCGKSCKKRRQVEVQLETWAYVTEDSASQIYSWKKLAFMNN